MWLGRDGGHERVAAIGASRLLYEEEDGEGREKPRRKCRDNRRRQRRLRSIGCHATYATDCNLSANLGPRFIKLFEWPGPIFVHSSRISGRPDGGRGRRDIR